MADPRRSRLAAAVVLTVSWCIAVGGLGLASIRSSAAAPLEASQAAPERHAAGLFLDRVEPLLRSTCAECHNDKRAEGGLRTLTREALLSGGDSGPALVPGRPDDSLIVRAIRRHDDEISAMPPDETLAADLVAAVETWVAAGAPWARRPMKLMEDEPEVLEMLSQGGAEYGVETTDKASGGMSIRVKSPWRFAERVPGWEWKVREHPGDDEYRYLRLSWKARGETTPMVEIAYDGRWPDAKSPKGRITAGPTRSDLVSRSLSPDPPREWTTITIDLWDELGDCTVTGICLAANGARDAGEALFDAIVIGRDLESLEVYTPSRALESLASRKRMGAARTDARNPVARRWGGERLDLWSLARPVKPAVPAVAAAPAPIDAFHRDALAHKSLAASPPADPATLARRVIHDLTGLPATAAEIASFVAAAQAGESEANAAYENLVDRLLASPAYGEHLGRLWLDAVRYADTNGCERDEFRPEIWRYRDWVIEAFNADMPYDEFLGRQFAGDELAGAAPAGSEAAKSLAATGFLRLGPYDSTAAVFQETERHRAEVLAEIVSTAGSAVLGMTMSCCNCHDHKYDPLLQSDFYRLQAFFQQTEAKDTAIEGVGTVSLVTDAAGTIPPTRLLAQGNHREPREEVEPGVLAVFDPNPLPAATTPGGQTTGRRTALADWVASADNPLTPRVIVNRVWQRLFGRGIVATPNDFGFRGAAPTHPELFDWLTVTFVEEGWSLKKLHRRILLSAAYRQSSAHDPAKATIDLDNRLVWRQNPRRLEAEAIRDAILAVSGLLRDERGGPPRWPPVDDAILETSPAILEFLKDGAEGRKQGWYAQPLEETFVRSIYLVRKRSIPLPFLQPFDLPDAVSPCGCRDVTIVPPQALNLLNDPLVVEASRTLAGRVRASVGDDVDRWPDEAVRLVLARDAAESERAAAADLLARHTQAHADGQSATPAVAALEDLCRALFNTSEFIIVD
jgi:mono/diheme cytochrome c family protein